MSAPSSLEDVVVSTSRPKPANDTHTKKQPPYAVIVENDDHHTFLYVIEALSKVCGHALEKGFVLAQTIHTQGRAVVWSGTLELAELKRDQLRGFGPDHYAPQPVTFPLGVTVEPLP